MVATTFSPRDLLVINYFTCLWALWDKMDNFRLDPMCVCKKYTCNTLLIVIQCKCEDEVMQLLRGLKNQFLNIKSHILLLELIPPISKIFFSYSSIRMSTHAKTHVG